MIYIFKVNQREDYVKKYNKLLYKTIALVNLNKHRCKNSPLLGK